MKTLILLYAGLLFFALDLQAQVTRINSDSSLRVTFPLTSNKTILVSDTDSVMWVTDGTLAGTVPLSHTIKYVNAGGLISGKLIFSGFSDSTGSEIYITDGTTAGTILVKDIVPGKIGSDPADMAFLNGYIYFSAVTAATGRELWKTNGTPGGTTLVKDILPGAAGSNGQDSFELFSNGSYLLFAARTVSSGTELWKSDGTGAGTTLLKNINLNSKADSSSSNPNSFFKYNNLVLFVATDTAHGTEIWKTDGTPGGTVLLKDIKTGPLSSTSIIISPAIPPFIPEISLPIFLGFHLFNNHVYFNASDGSSNGELWSTDGTNTVLLKNVINASYPVIARVFLADAINLPTKFIFPVSDGKKRSELWQSDGTGEGTKLFKAFSAKAPGEFPYALLPYSIDFINQTLGQSLFQGNKFFFVASDSANGRELWITDGIDSTPAHSHIVKDINPKTANGIASAFTSYVYTATALFFAAKDNSHGNELWKTDGTAAGTSLVADINPNSGNSDPELPFFVSNGKIVFTATDGDGPDGATDLFVVDGNFSPLPIKLSEFTVTLKDKDALLQWSTLTEANSKDFTIQRSFDGQHFENIGNVPASTTSSSKHEYSFTDGDVVNSGKSIIYYRIISSDKDGKTETTNIIFIKLKGETRWMVKLLSNPVQNFANLMLNDITGELKLSIRDLSGRILYSTSKQNINGQISIPVAILKPGMYVLIAETNNERRTIQFIKQ